MPMHISTCLATCAADLDPGLADAAAVQAICRRSSDFSAAVCAAYVECRIGNGSRQLDLLACTVDPSSPFRDHVGDNGGVALARRIQEARRFEDGALSRLVPLTWLEFDDVGEPSASEDPSVCMCLEPRYLARDGLATPRPEISHAAVDAAADLGMFADAEAGAAEALHAWIDALPASGRAIHVSVMRGRPSAPVKLYLRIGTKEAAQYLTRIGWHGRRTTLERVLAWQATRGPDIHLDLTLRCGLPAPRLGTAFPCPRRHTRFDRQVFYALGAIAMRSGEREAGWHAAQRWVRGTAALSQGGGWPCIVHRWIDQKLVIDDGGAELKLYLGCRPLPFLIGAGREAAAWLEAAS